MARRGRGVQLHEAMCGAHGAVRLLQVLWCPHDHEPDWKPVTALVWRSAAAVTDVLSAPPEPLDADYEGYLPKPCLLAPERITEYPDSLDLDRGLRESLEDRSRARSTAMSRPSRPVGRSAAGRRGAAPTRTAGSAPSATRRWSPC
ncbi:hypothetical protein [Streptomyces sp. NPDC002535]